MSYEAKFHPAKTAAELAAEDPHIGQYEIAVASDTGEMKVGPGRWSELNYVDGGYKQYGGLFALTDSGFTASKISRNTLGGSAPVLTREDTGLFTISHPALSADTEIMVTLGTVENDVASDGVFVRAYGQAGEVKIRCYHTGGGFADPNATQCTLRIFVPPVQ